MSIARWAVHRPVGTWMLIAAMIVLGGTAMRRLPLALFPDITFPAAVVITDYPNVGPWEVESQVTRPLEEVLATVSNATRVSSTSAPGQSTVVVEFNWGADMDFAALEMRERIDLVRDFLPDGVGSPRIFKFDPSLQPMFTFSVGGTSDLVTLRRRVDEEVKPRLERLEGVASVSVSGGLEREIRIEVDQAKLKAWGLTLNDIQQALAAGNLNLPGGTIVAGERELLLRTVGEFESLDQIRQTVIAAGPAGVVRVGDVAAVLDTFKPGASLSRLNGAPSVTVNVQKESEANTVEVSDAVLAELERLRRDYAGELEFVTVWDEARFIRSSISSVFENAYVGALCAMLVLFLFLRAIGPTVIVGVAIPVAAVATFFFLDLLGVSLNILSLGGLALGVGMLVDNAIVSLENIVRHRQLGKPPIEAAIRGADEIGGAIGSSTLTTIAVFLPIVFVGGLAAELFRDLSYAVTFSLVMSLVVALTFVPLLASRFTHHAGLRPEGPVFGAVRRVYERALDWTVHHRAATIAMVLVAFAAAAIMATRIETEFIPQSDTGEGTVSVRLPYGSTLEATDAVVQRLEEFIAGLPEVERISTAVGGSGGNERASLQIVLRPQEERSRSTQEVLEEIRAFGATLPGAEIRARTADLFGTGGTEGGAPIVVNLRGNDYEALQAAAREVARRIEAVPGTRDVVVGSDSGRPELQIHIDRDRAAQLGLTVGQIASAVRTAVDGTTVTRYRPGAGGTEIDVTVVLAEEDRRSPAALEQLMIATPLGGSVPLSAVARLTEAQSPITIARSDQSRVVTVVSQLSDRALGAVIADIRAALEDVPLPPGVTVDFGGQNEQMVEAFSDLSVAFILAIALTYMILAVQFESLVQPFIIMMSVPLGLIGVVLGLLVFGTNLSVPAFVGVIMLAGIVVNNGIVMVDYINQLRREGTPLDEAVVAGASTRLRPVLMTASTTVLGMFPLALGIGEGAELQAPIAVVVVGGLTVSTLLTLLVTPVLYLLAEAVRAWLRGLVRLRPRSVGAEAAVEEAS
ncbi:MAG TPA: efflux RND transporter permease subunit [Limnochordia bacterium]